MNSYRSIGLLVAMFACGCGHSERTEIAKLQRELEQARTEIRELQTAARTANYLDELERLEALRAKNVLSQVEFNARRDAVLAALDRPKPAPAVASSTGLLTMTDMAEQLRNVNTLYQKSTITSTDRDQAKKNLIAKPLLVTNMAKDLELVGALYQESVITSTERDELKKKLISSDAPVK